MRARSRRDNKWAGGCGAHVVELHAVDDVGHLQVPVEDHEYFWSSTLLPEHWEFALASAWHCSPLLAEPRVFMFMLKEPKPHFALAWAWQPDADDGGDGG